MLECKMNKPSGSWNHMKTKLRGKAIKHVYHTLFHVVVTSLPETFNVKVKSDWLITGYT